MFGIEIIAALIGVGGIAAAYFIISYSLREKTYEEALAEQRGGRGDAAKALKKDKLTKKPKKKVTSDGGSSDAGSPVKERKIPTVAKEKHTKEAEKPKDGPVAAAHIPEKIKHRPDELETVAGEGKVKPAGKIPSAPAAKKTEKKVENDHRKPDETYAEAVKLHADNIPVEKKQEQVGKAKEQQEGAVKTKEHKQESGKKERDTATATQVKSAPVEHEAPKKTKTEVRSEKPVKQDTRGAHKEDAKKAVAPAVNGLTSGSVYQEVLGLLNSIPLSDAETQKLFQILIDKQSERHTEWVQLGKSKQVDPSTIAKRLIADRERELVEEKELNKALADQLRDMKNLLNAEKSRLREVNDVARVTAERVPTLETEVKNLTGRLKQGQDKHAVEITQMTQKLQEAESRAAMKIKHLEERLHEHSQHSVVHVQNGNGELRGELETLRAERDRLLQEVNHNRSQTQHLEQQIKDLQHEKEQIQSDNQSHDSDDAMREELDRLRQSAAETETQVRSYNELEEKYTEKVSSLQRLREELESLRGHSAEQSQNDGNRQEEVDKLRQRISQLENALTESESKHHETAKHARDEGFEHAKNQYEPEVHKADKAHREMLSRLLPHVNVDPSLNRGDWLAQFEGSARSSLQSADKSDEVGELRRQLDELKGAHEAAERYRVALNQTEEKLRSVERSVESEEEKWELVEKKALDYEDKCKNLETQLSEVVSEKENVHKLLEERSSSITEMEHRLRENEERLRAFSAVESRLNSLQEEAERMKADLGETRRHKDELLSEVTSLRENLSEAQRLRSEHEERIDSLLAEVNERRVSSGDTNDLRREVQDLRNSLDFERDNARKLAQEVIRSKSLIQSGLDALRKEEDTVLRLQQALESYQRGVNGTDGGGDRIIHDRTGRSDSEGDRGIVRKKRKRLSKRSFLKAFLCGT
ncbi:ribosome-binding protein 1-like isoform X2 [Paramacrobiotus metropolitanus]|uniref:ribosome-binding protein 1-like isoform X2 n=1 Tax=Paramacrobiotus metropolitanus TaxID=2943436 RepID=UPI002445A863|nr:ribosome-binding protein 1-like isoform X2 [Paramacrobiotus metropolitanus]